MNGRYFLKIVLVLVASVVIGIAILVDRPQGTQIINLGQADSKTIWVYLCGLTRDWHDPLELENRTKLSCIGKKLGITFIAIKPLQRCSQFDDKLCWPHDSMQETLLVYDQILNLLPGVKISGFIGFSNGGFFLNKLVQCKRLDVPVISIASAGYLENDSYKNNLYLLVGKQDAYHIEGARQLHEQSNNLHVVESKDKRLDVQLIEFENGHVIPEKLLESLIASLMY